MPNRILFASFLLGAAAQGIYKRFPDSYPKLRAGHNETELFRNVLPLRLLEHLSTYLEEYNLRPFQSGTGTNYVPLDRNHSPRNPVEEVVQYLAAHVVKPPSSWAGVDWWIQFRPPNEPKEYHTDSDTARLNENHERYHPRLSSVFFLSDTGGPTVVFNQSLRKYGATPRLPAQLHLVTPKKNSYMTFLGDRYHGVVASDGGASKGARKTLLINWWHYKPYEGKEDAELCYYQPGYKPLMPTLLQGQAAKSTHSELLPHLGFFMPVIPEVVDVQESFDTHLELFHAQKLPPYPNAELSKNQKNRKGWTRSRLTLVRYVKQSVLATQIDKNQVIPMFGMWKLTPEAEGLGISW